MAKTKSQQSKFQVTLTYEQLETITNLIGQEAIKFNKQKEFDTSDYFVKILVALNSSIK